MNKRRNEFIKDCGLTLGTPHANIMAQAWDACLSELQAVEIEFDVEKAQVEAYGNWDYYSFRGTQEDCFMGGARWQFNQNKTALAVKQLEMSRSMGLAVGALTAIQASPDDFNREGLDKLIDELRSIAECDK